MIHKKLLAVLVIFALIVSCGIRENNSVEKSFSVSELMLAAEELIEKEIDIEGIVSHVCSHSGRRCFIVDSESDKTIRIEAAGNFGNFSRELMGQKITVKGTLKEYRMPASDIDEWESDLAEKGHQSENDGEQCSAEMANINQMRQWMKEHNRDYYSIYYIDGLSYEVAN